MANNKTKAELIKELDEKDLEIKRLGSVIDGLRTELRIRKHGNMKKVITSSDIRPKGNIEYQGDE